MVLGGFPRSGLDTYVGKLVRAGHSVAVAFQNGRKEPNLEEVIRVSRGADGEASGSGEDVSDGAL